MQDMFRKKRYYVNEEELPGLLRDLTREQERSRVFVSVTAKPYTGKKHENCTLVVTVG